LEVSGQLHAPAGLALRKKPPLPFGYEAGWTSEQVWRMWRKFLTLPGLEFLGVVERILKLEVTYV
jgi:hypothetical protein